MKKKIMVLSGSPRKNGNTNTVVQWFTEGAKEAGADVEVIDISRLKSTHHGCISCLACQKSDRYECAINDDVKPVLARIPTMDVVVFATPTYFFGPSAQLKSLLDRMYSLLKFKGPGKYDHNLGHITFGLIATAGGGIQPGLQFIEDTFQTVAGFIKAKFSSLLVPNASTYSEGLKTDAALKEKARAYGRTLAA